MLILLLEVLCEGLFKNLYHSNVVLKEGLGIHIVSERIILSLTTLRLKNYRFSPGSATAFLQDPKHMCVKWEEYFHFEISSVLLILVVGLGPCVLHLAAFIHPGVPL